MAIIAIMAISYISKSPKCNESVGIFVGTLKIDKA